MVSGMAHPQLELIDDVIDATHRSRLDDGEELPVVLRLRTPDHWWRLDERWIPRYIVNIITRLSNFSIFTNALVLICQVEGFRSPSASSFG
jgi:hypothetical protein